MNSWLKEVICHWWENAWDLKFLRLYKRFPYQIVFSRKILTARINKEILAFPPPLSRKFIFLILFFKTKFQKSKRSKSLTMYNRIRECNCLWYGHKEQSIRNVSRSTQFTYPNQNPVSKVLFSKNLKMMNLCDSCKWI